MGPRLPGRILADASFGLRYGQDVPLGQPARSDNENEPIWSLRIVMIGARGRSTRIPIRQSGPTSASIAVERRGPEHPN